WLVMRAALVNLLKFDCEQINNYIKCYDPAYNTNGLRWFLAYIIDFFSLKRNDTVAFQLQQAKQSVQNLASIIDGVKSARDLAQEREILRSHLNIICHL